MSKTAILITAAAINVFAAAIRQRQEESARRYASFDKSDPHAYNRAMSHARFGLCGAVVVKEHGKDVTKSGMYDADTFPGTKEIDPRWEPLMAFKGANLRRSVQCTEYRNVVRP